MKMVTRDAALNSVNSSTKATDSKEQEIIVIFSPDGRRICSIRRVDSRPKPPVEEDEDDVEIIDIE